MPAPDVTHDSAQPRCPSRAPHHAVAQTVSAVTCPVCVVALQEAMLPTRASRLLRWQTYDQALPGVGR